MEKEQWDLYDSCFTKTGELHMRGDSIPPNRYHLVVNVYPVNEKKQLLVQKRSNEVEWFPGDWAATGGSAILGEDPWQACQRELYEELGIRAVKENSEMAAVFKRADSFNAIWIIRMEIEAKNIVVQKEEVAKAKWMDMDEIKERIAKGTFHRYSYMDWLFEYIKNMK